MINLTGLWINENDKGQKYMKGSIGRANVLVFKNDKKEPGSNQPAYNLVIAPNDKKKGDR